MYTWRHAEFVSRFISAICSLWPKSGTAKCITSRPTFKSGTARAVPLRYVPTPLAWTHNKERCYNVNRTPDDTCAPQHIGMQPFLKSSHLLTMSCYHRNFMKRFRSYRLDNHAQTHTHTHRFPQTDTTENNTTVATLCADVWRQIYGTIRQKRQTPRCTGMQQFVNSLWT